MRAVDAIIWPEWVVPVVPRETVLRRHGVVVADGRIVAIVPADGITPFEAREEIHLPNHALLPGLVNAHTHAAMNLMRGLGDDLALHPWLEQRIWPTEARLVDAAFVRDGTRHAIAEMIRGGVTCANDMYFFPDAAVEVAREAGFRFVAGLPIVEFPTAWASDPDEYLERAAAVLADVAGDRLAGATLSPHAPYTVADPTFRKVSALAARFDARVDIHLHETREEVERALAEHGERPFARLDRLGLIGPTTLAVHMTTVTEEEIARAAQARLQVVHCPESNLKLASGFCPVRALLDAGVNVALGTDGAASNNDLDLLGEMRSAALLAKAVANDATAVSAPVALEMATINGARALGMDDRTGSIEVGKRADLVAVDLGTLEAQPVYDVISHLVYATGRHQVREVWIDGRRVLDNRRLTTLDGEAVVAAVHAWHDRIIEGLAK